MANGFPSSDNEYPPLTLPLHGFTKDEQDTMELMRHNALTSNEQRGKLEWMLRYLAPFSEEIITGADGMQYFVLAKPTGTLEIAVETDYHVYYSGDPDTPVTFTDADILENYEPPEEDGSETEDNWGILFEVVDNELTGVTSFVAKTERFILDGADPPVQTGYYLPVIREGKRVSSGGLYQEDSMCDDGTPVVGLIKVG